MEPISKLYGTNCSVCSKPLVEECVRLIESGLVVHDECFQCQACEKDFHDLYWQHQGKMLCLPDYLTCLQLKCEACNDVLSSKDELVVRAQNRLWHSRHFLCGAAENGCSNLSEEGGDYLVVAGKLSCVKHAALACARCNAPVAVEGAVKVHNLSSTMYWTVLNTLHPGWR